MGDICLGGEATESTKKKYSSTFILKHAKTQVWISLQPLRSIYCRPFFCVPNAALSRMCRKEVGREGDINKPTVRNLNCSAFSL